MPPKANNTSGPTRELPPCKHILPAHLQQQSDEPASKKIKPTKATKKNTTHEEQPNKESNQSADRITETEKDTAIDITDVEDEEFNEITELPVDKEMEEVNEITGEQKLSE